MISRVIGGLQENRDSPDSGGIRRVSLLASAGVHKLRTFRQYRICRSQLPDLPSCYQDLIEIMKFLIDVGRIGHSAGYFHPERFTITLTQTRKPCPQCCYRDAKFLCRLILTERPLPSPGDKWP